MSKKSDRFDNAVAESFFGILKTEIDSTRNMPTAAVRELISDYEVFCDRKSSSIARAQY